MSLIRLCKAALVAGVAVFFTLVAYGNIADYDSNWQFVQHVLSMDTTFPNSSLHWRAITDPELQAAGYWLIIATEIVTAALLWIGALALLSTRARPTVAALGLTLGFLLYSVGFVSVGGEWFAMWQSQIWNGEQKAFDFLIMIGAVLIVVLLPEAFGDSIESRPHPEEPRSGVSEDGP